MAKYLITGGCGFIGSHLAEALIKRGDEVVILDNLSSGKRENAPPKAQLIIGDITSKEDLQKALQGSQGVFHLAAVVSVNKSIDAWAETTRINLYGTTLLIEMMLEQREKIPLVFASSSAVYGKPRSVPLRESCQPNPISPYGADKLGCERHLLLAERLKGLPATALRLFNVYGPRQDASSPYSGVISIFARRIDSGEPLPIYGTGNQQRDFIYVKDVVLAFIAAMDHKKSGKVYNVCTGTGTSIVRLADLLSKIAGSTVAKNFLPQRAGDIPLSIGDPTKGYNELDLKPQISLEEGLALLLDLKPQISLEEGLALLLKYTHAKVGS